MERTGETLAPRPEEIHIEGERIYLRPLVEKDITNRYLSWFRDPKVTRFLEARNLTHEEACAYLIEGWKTGSYYMFAICLRLDDFHIGNVKVGPIDWKHRICDLVTLIGDKDYWGQGLATEAIKLGSKLAFEAFQIRKLSGGIYSENIGSIRSYLKAGWMEEGRLRGHYILEGKIMDRVCVSCFNPEYFPEKDKTP